MAPWEGQNALDAAYLAYTGVSMMRQQMKPDHRVHGVVYGRDWAANSKIGYCAQSFISKWLRNIVIPDYSRMRYDHSSIESLRSNSALAGTMSVLRLGRKSKSFARG